MTQADQQCSGGGRSQHRRGPTGGIGGVVEVVETTQRDVWPGGGEAGSGRMVAAWMTGSKG